MAGREQKSDAILFQNEKKKERKWPSGGNFAELATTPPISINKGAIIMDSAAYLILVKRNKVRPHDNRNVEMGRVSLFFFNGFYRAIWDESRDHFLANCLSVAFTGR